MGARMMLLLQLLLMTKGSGVWRGGKRTRGAGASHGRGRAAVAAPATDGGSRGFGLLLRVLLLEELAIHLLKADGTSDALGGQLILDGLPLQDQAALEIRESSRAGFEGCHGAQHSLGGGGSLSERLEPLSLLRLLLLQSPRDRKVPRGLHGPPGGFELARTPT